MMRPPCAERWFAWSSYETKAKPRVRRILGPRVSSRRQLFPFLEDHAREKQGRSPAFVGEPIRQWVMVKLKVIVFVADPLVPVTVNVASVGFFVMGGGVPPPP